MNKYFFGLLLLSFLSLITSCSKSIDSQVFPNQFDTHDRPIVFQVKKTYAFEDDNVFADNQFDGARLNNFYKNNSVYTAQITPENEPINESAYYAFRLWSTEKRTIQLDLEY